jgi:hypothetical protein
VYTQFREEKQSPEKKRRKNFPNARREGSTTLPVRLPAIEIAQLLQLHELGSSPLLLGTIT